MTFVLLSIGDSALLQHSQQYRRDFLQFYVRLITGRIFVKVRNQEKEEALVILQIQVTAVVPNSLLNLQCLKHYNF